MLARVNLLDFDQNSLSNYFVSIGEKSFRAAQIMQWIHYFGVTDVNLFSNISKNLRQKLAQETTILLPKIISEQVSQDGTRKWLLKLHCGNSIETVFIPEGKRGTLCVSSQAGCALNCSFCSTGKQGFNRNLTVSEIISQVFIAVRKLSENHAVHDQKITNIVMMGMGEPLLNFENVVKAMNIMMQTYGLSKRRVTLSTSGVIPAMQKLSAHSDVSLAVSLHASNDKLRDILVPVNKKYNLSALMAVCKNYFKNEPRRKIMFEYVMLAGINDQKEHAYELTALLKHMPAKVNLIPFNAFPQAPYQCSRPEVINNFLKILRDGDIFAITRKTRGSDIDAACGQLRGNVIDRTRRRTLSKLKNLNNNLIKIQDKTYNEKLKKIYLQDVSSICSDYSQ